MVPTGLQTRYGRFIKHFQKIYEHRERQGREVRSLDHYYNVANYLRENGADPVLILAGLYKGIIDPEHVKIPGISSFGWRFTSGIRLTLASRLWKPAVVSPYSN